MTTATQVADWIVRFRHDELAAPVDAMSLAKLAYYAQGFWLALTGQELFAEHVAAWRHGPVVRSVWDAYREHGAQPIIPTGEGCPLEKPLEDFLSEVVNFFGAYTALQLSKATHAEEPWLNARVGYSRYENSDVIIPKSDLRSYYCGLIAAGEEALSRHELLDVVAHPRWAHLYIAGICQRKMLDHPLYNPGLAKRLSERISELPELGDGFYEPIGKPDYLVFSPREKMS